MSLGDGQQRFPGSRLAKTASIGVLVIAPLVLAFAPEGRLACDEPWVTTERSPDHAWTLTVCRRPMLFAMPGGSGDAPGWIVLRDADGAIRGVVHLDMVQLLAEVGPAGGTRWQSERVVLSGLAEIPLSQAAGPISRWFVDRIWRVRALIGAVPADSISAQE